MDKHNTTFKEDIEASSKKEAAEQLQLHNDVMMETINQRFTSFQCVILKKMKDLVIQMVPQLSNQQRSNLLSPSPHEMLHTQPPTYSYQGAFLNHSYP